MEKISKVKDLEGFNQITIETNEGKFDISYCGNQDLYMGLYSKNHNRGEKKEFNITKEDFYIFDAFDKFFNNVKNHANEEKQMSFDDIKPFKNNEIIWYSDDNEQNNASKLSIKQSDDKNSYKLTFYNGTMNGSDIVTYFVRICNSGSRYKGYNYYFMKLYQDLLAYNYDLHQIHFEEYLFKKQPQRSFVRR